MAIHGVIVSTVVSGDSWGNRYKLRSGMMEGSDSHGNISYAVGGGGVW